MTGGIIRGVGKQRVGALCTLVGYYVIGLPIGLSLMFPAGMGIVGEDELSIKYGDFTVITVIIKNMSSFSGLWLGLLICVILETAFYLLYLSKLNWQTVTEEASTCMSVYKFCFYPRDIITCRLIIELFCLGKGHPEGRGITHR